jgi:hypothetical protein
MYGAPPIDWNGADTVKFCYSVYFPNDFDFFLGGKQPGLFAYDPEKSPKNCKDIYGEKCFSSRFMWRPNAEGEIYPSLDQKIQGSDYIENPKQSGTGPGDLGDSLGRGSFQFVKGKWNHLCQELSKSKKYIKVSVDPFMFKKVTKNPVIFKQNINFNDFPFRGLQLAAFFGGGTSYASPKTQYSYYTDFSVEIL